MSSSLSSFRFREAAVVPSSSQMCFAVPSALIFHLFMWLSWMCPSQVILRVCLETGGMAEEAGYFPPAGRCRWWLCVIGLMQVTGQGRRGHRFEIGRQQPRKLFLLTK